MSVICVFVSPAIVYMARVPDITFGYLFIYSIREKRRSHVPSRESTSENEQQRNAERTCVFVTVITAAMGCDRQLNA